jgi:hypothetical protein
MPKKLTQEEVREIVEAIGYDAERLRYIGYEVRHRDERGNWSKPKIKWEILATGEVVWQELGTFRKGHKPTKTKKEYEVEVANILKQRDLDKEYSFEVEMGRHVNVHLTRLSDEQKGSLILTSFRSGKIPKQFVYNCWDLGSFRKHFSEVQPEISKCIEVLEYIPGIVYSHTARPTKVKLREISSSKEVISTTGNLLQGKIPQSFDLCVHPRNDIPSKLYICLVSEYCKKQGPFITVGVTTNNLKQRYGKHLLKQIYLSDPQLNAVTTEKIILNQVTDALGPPHAGDEAWLHTDESLALITEIFLLTTKSNT